MGRFAVEPMIYHTCHWFLIMCTTVPVYVCVHYHTPPCYSPELSYYSSYCWNVTICSLACIDILLCTLLCGGICFFFSCWSDHLLPDLGKQVNDHFKCHLVSWLPHVLLLHCVPLHPRWLHPCHPTCRQWHLPHSDLPPTRHHLQDWGGGCEEGRWSRQTWCKGHGELHYWGWAVFTEFLFSLLSLLVVFSSIRSSIQLYNKLMPLCTSLLFAHVMFTNQPNDRKCNSLT